MFKLIKKVILSSVCVVGSQSFAQELNPSRPTYYPSCGVAFESTGLRVMTSADCKNIFLAPNPIGEVYSKITVNGNAQAECNKMHLKYKVLEENLEDRTDSRRKLAIAIEQGDQEKIDNLLLLIKLADEYEVKLTEEIKQSSNLQGAQVSFSYFNEVTEEDELNFITENARIFHNMGYFPKVTAATIEDSIYSFKFINEPLLETQPQILSSTLPGLEILNQNGASQVNVAHVLSNGPVSGDIDVSLNAICTIGEDSATLNTEGLSSLMNVNRTYKIAALSQYGYKASFNATRAIKAAGTIISESKDHGFTQTQINDLVFNNDFDDDILIEFFEGHAPDDPLIVSEIIEDVQERFEEKLYKSLEASNLIEVTGYQDREPAQGGEIDEQHIGRACKRKWYGSKRCWDYVYNVKKWVDGYSSLDLNDYSETNLNFSELVIIDDMIDKNLGSTFSNNNFDKGDM